MMSFNQIVRMQGGFAGSSRRDKYDDDLIFDDVQSNVLSNAFEFQTVPDKSSKKKKVA
jgi:hypothetical protein